MLYNKTTIVITSIFFLIFCQTTMSAQGWKKRPALVTGKITAGFKAREDSILFCLYKDYQILGYTSQTLPINDKGEFTIHTDSLERPAFLAIYINNKRTLSRRFIEPGDSLQLEINAASDEPKLLYSGKNSLKYQCEDSLDLIKLNDETLPLKEGRLTGDYQSLNRMYLERYLQYYHIIEAYKGKVSAPMLSFLLARYSGNSLGIYYGLIADEYKAEANPGKRKLIVENYYKYALPDYSANGDTAALDEFYILSIITQAKNEMLFKSNGQGYPYTSLYHYLKTHYTGELRDRLLVYLLIDLRSLTDVIGYTPADYSSCMQDAKQTVVSPYLKNILTDRSVLLKNSEAFNFSMPDTSGKIVSLSDFRGKVVLLDVWGAGCTGCAMFYERFEAEVNPKIKNEPNFKKVTINIDRTKERWLQGIDKGIYTSKAATNLWTGGLVMDHPFVKYYKFNAIPFILLLGKTSKIYSKIDITLSSDQVHKLITEALAE